jgi:hypothetical protein
MPSFPAVAAPLLRGCYNYLPYDIEAWFVGGQAKHDEICVCAVDAVGLVGVVVWGRALLAYEFHYFVLSFPGAAGVGEDDSEVFPVAVGGEADEEVGADGLADGAEEGGAGGDEVGVEGGFVDVGLYLGCVDLLAFELLE